MSADHWNGVVSGLLLLLVIGLAVLVLQQGRELTTLGAVVGRLEASGTGVSTPEGES